MNPGRTFAYFLLLVLLMLGCAPTMPVGQPEQTPLAFTNGVLQAEYRTDSKRAYDAAWAALQDFNMKVVNSKRDATGGYIQAIHPDGRDINVSFRALDQENTAVGIRVGDLGDEELSRAVIRRLEAHLG
jgi:hypothetical protein